MRFRTMKTTTTTTMNDDNDEAKITSKKLKLLVKIRDGVSFVAIENVDGTHMDCFYSIIVLY